MEISYSTQEGDLKKLEIIGADALLNNSLVEEGSIVYFNQGSRDGVSEGEIYKLFSDQENFFINKVNSLSRYAALVKIIKSEEDFATGIIYNLKDKLSAKDGYRKNKF